MSAGDQEIKEETNNRDFFRFSEEDDGNESALADRKR